jgi:hypothetical protein
MKKSNNDNKLQIRNSTAEFLIFAYQSKGDGVEVHVQDGTIWLSQKNMAAIFDTSSDNIGLHLKNIYSEKELFEKSTTEDFSVVQIEGTREVCRMVKHYNLDAAISIGYRVNSKRAKHLDLILSANGKDLLQNAGKITAALAKHHAENEYEKYRPIQDHLFESDFDKEIKRLKENNSKNSYDE